MEEDGKKEKEKKYGECKGGKDRRRKIEKKRKWKKEK